MTLLSRTTGAIAVVAMMLFLPAISEADSLDATGDLDIDDGVEAREIEIDGSLDDAEGTIEDAVEQRGLSIAGDLRVAYSYFDLDRLNVTSEDEKALRMRWRVGGALGMTEYLRVGARIAGICSTEDCDPDLILQPDIPTPNGIEDGQITLDEFYLHWFRHERFDLALGRLQTKFVARGGVYAKSLDRNDSNNLRVNWTDGFHGTAKLGGDWTSHLILQYNSSDGASNVRRHPLDFRDDDARVTYFLAFENLERDGYLIQRGVDISYLPQSLLTSGLVNGPREDYWGLVARAAGRWPKRNDGPRLRISGELGYAPETQTRTAVGLPGTDDADGLAWAVTASIMEFLPTHSIGVNYAQTDPGWLLSPQYGSNEELFEIRYQWRRNRQLAIDIRGRWRRQLEQLVTSESQRDEFDFYLRVTWGFSVKAL